MTHALLTALGILAAVALLGCPVLLGVIYAHERRLADLKDGRIGPRTLEAIRHRHDD